MPGNPRKSTLKLSMGQSAGIGSWLNMVDPCTKGYKTDLQWGFVSQIPYEFEHLHDTATKSVFVVALYSNVMNTSCNSWKSKWAFKRPWHGHFCQICDRVVLNTKGSIWISSV
jgi:hypothetical protein